MARFRQPYQPRERLERLSSPLDELSLNDVGLGFPVQVFLFSLSLFPFIGIVIGFYYSNNELHYGTRSLGRLMMAFGLLINIVYFCVVCPAAFYFALS